MLSLSSVRLTIPKATPGEIPRRQLLDAVLAGKQKFIYIHAGAGYGKSTLLAQIARAQDNTVWLTLDGENDVFTFLTTLGKGIRHVFRDYDFAPAEYLAYEGKPNFITVLANAWVSGLEKLNQSVMLVIDDLHSATDPQVRQLIGSMLKYLPENICFCLSSREAPWPELIPLFDPKTRKLSDRKGLRHCD